MESPLKFNDYEHNWCDEYNNSIFREKMKRVLSLTPGGMNVSQNKLYEDFGMICKKDQSVESCYIDCMLAVDSMCTNKDFRAIINEFINSASNSYTFPIIRSSFHRKMIYAYCDILGVKYHANIVRREKKRKYVYCSNGQSCCGSWKNFYITSKQITIHK